MSAGKIYLHVKSLNKICGKWSRYPMAIMHCSVDLIKRPKNSLMLDAISVSLFCLQHSYMYLYPKSASFSIIDCQTLTGIALNDIYHSMVLLNMYNKA